MQQYKIAGKSKKRAEKQEKEKKNSKKATSRNLSN